MKKYLDKAVQLFLVWWALVLFVVFLLFAILTWYLPTVLAEFYLFIAFLFGGTSMWKYLWKRDFKK